MIFNVLFSRFLIFFHAFSPVHTFFHDFRSFSRFFKHFHDFLHTFCTHFDTHFASIFPSCLSFKHSGKQGAHGDWCSPCLRFFVFAWKEGAVPHYFFVVILVFKSLPTLLDRTTKKRTKITLNLNDSKFKWHSLEFVHTRANRQ